METERPEIIVNLWYFLDLDSGIVYRLAGRAYLATGSDEAKLSLLKRLALHDWHAAQWFEVPSHCVVVRPDGQEMAGYTTVYAVKNDASILFEEVFKSLEKEIKPHIQFFDGQGLSIPLSFPIDPLCVTTALVEDSDGCVRAHTSTG